MQLKRDKAAVENELLETQVSVNNISLYVTLM